MPVLTAILVEIRIDLPLEMPGFITLDAVDTDGSMNTTSDRAPCNSGVTTEFGCFL